MPIQLSVPNEGICCWTTNPAVLGEYTTEEGFCGLEIVIIVAAEWSSLTYRSIINM